MRAQKQSDYDCRLAHAISLLDQEPEQALKVLYQLTSGEDKTRVHAWYVVIARLYGRKEYARARQLAEEAHKQVTLFDSF